MKIRAANLRDTADLVEMGEKFWKTTKYYEQGVEYDEDTVSVLIYNIMQDGLIVVATEAEKIIGFILVAFTPWHFNKNVLTATEVAYYIEEEYRNAGLGRDLINTAEYVCRERGCKYLTLVTMASSPKHVGRFYQMLGYQPAETAYTKELEIWPQSQQ